MDKLPDQVINDLWGAVSGGSITIINNSDQLIKARIDTSYPGESGAEYHIHSGSSEKWSRLKQEVVRICAYGLWHDFKLSPGAVVRLNPEFYLEIVDGHNRFQWNARVDGPHI
jgi:hypothetical protein